MPAVENAESRAEDLPADLRCGAVGRDLGPVQRYTMEQAAGGAMVSFRPGGQGGSGQAAGVATAQVLLTG
jgi:hypothetical protein